MGSVMSLSCSKRKATSQDVECSSESRKRRKISSENDEEECCRLIPSLPDELSIQILARLPRICYSSVRLVSRRWRSAVSTSEVYSLRKELGRTEEWLYVLTKGHEDKLLWYALDPVSTKWQRLPPMPVVVYEEESRKSLSGLWNMITPSFNVGAIVRSFLGRRDSSEQMPFCGCAIGAVDGGLYVIGGLSRSKTVSCVWRFDPILNSWSEVSSMLASRAYSKTGVLNKKLYVVGGVDRGRGGLSPLQSAEVYDPNKNRWSFIADMSTAMVPLIGVVYDKKWFLKGLGSHQLVMSEAYDPEVNSWSPVSDGMVAGWRNPCTSLNGRLYGLDCRDGCKLRVFDESTDSWNKFMDSKAHLGNSKSLEAAALVPLHNKLCIIRNNMSMSLVDVSNPDKNNPRLWENIAVKGQSKSILSNIWSSIAGRALKSHIVHCQVLQA